MNERGNAVQQEKNTEWITGLKGIAAMMIFLHHYCLEFLPGLFYGEDADFLLENGSDVFLSSSPLGFFASGTFFIYVFIVLSGFLFAFKTMRANKENRKLNYWEICVKRYFKLAFTVFALGAIKKAACFLTNWFGLGESCEYSFLKLVEVAFFSQWTGINQAISGVLWPMYVFFMGAILALLFANLSSEKNCFAPAAYLFLAFLSWKTDFYSSGIFFGMILADFTVFDRLKFLRRIFITDRTAVMAGNILGAVLILAGLTLGSVPPHSSPSNAFHIWLAGIVTNRLYLYVIGVFLVVGGCLLLTKHVLLSSGAAVFLGRISMELFLTHCFFINTFGHVIINFLVKLTGGRYVLSVSLGFLILTAAVIPISILYGNTVSRLINALADILSGGRHHRQRMEEA